MSSRHPFPYPALASHPFGGHAHPFFFPPSSPPHLCSGHASDIYDISWSPDSLQLVSGAVDNTAIVWDVVKGRAITRLEGHSQFVQGVAWDPAGTYIATQSNDRTARVFAPVTATKGGRGKKVAAASASAGPAEAWDCAAVLKTRQEVLPPSAAPAAGAAMSDDAGPAAPAPAPATRPVPLFLDETVPSFFRRPAWSPDGSLVFFPTGIYRPPLPAGGAAAASAGGAASSSSSAPAASASALAPRPTTFAFRRDAFTTPVAHFPGTPHTKATIAVRVAPVVYKLRGPADGPGNGSFTLPYRMRFAVASLDTVFIYDTESPFPEAVISGFHCEKISDIAWSGDGSLLFVSSIDGYASVVAFSSKDTGVPLPESDPAYPPVMLKNAAAGPTFVPKQPKHAGAGGAGGAAGGAAGEEGGAGAAAMGEGAAAAAVSTSAAAGADGVAASTAGTSAAAGGATVNVLQPRKRAVLIPVAVEGGAAAVAAPAAAPPAAPAPAPAPPAEAAPPAASDASAMTDE